MPIFWIVVTFLVHTSWSIRDISQINLDDKLQSNPGVGDHCYYDLRSVHDLGI